MSATTNGHATNGHTTNGYVANGQAQLIPDERAVGRTMELRLASLSGLANGDLCGPEPDAGFLASVERFGILQPVLLTGDLRNGRLAAAVHVADGRRRIKAARAVGLEAIPAIVYPRTWTVQDVLALVANEQRSDNPASDVRAIMTLLHQGSSEGEICAATGLPRATLRKRLKLIRLHSELFRAFEQGQISTSVAELAARLSESKQQALHELLQEQGKLRRKDVHDALRVQTEQATADLPEVLFVTPDAATSDATTSDAAASDATEPGGDWREPVQAMVEQALALVPEGKKPGFEYAVRAALQEAQRFLNVQREAIR